MSNTREAEEKFLKYDWNSPDFMEYYNKLENVPQGDKLTILKRKWYKKTVDTNFLITNNYRTAAESVSSATSTNVPPVSHTSTRVGNARGAIIATVFHILAIACSAVYVLPFVDSVTVYHIAQVFYCIAYVIDICAYHGRPKFDLTWIGAVFPDESAQALLLASFSVALHASPILCAIFGITSLLSIARNASHFGPYIGNAEQLQYFTNQSRQILAQKYFFMDLRALCEIFLGISLFYRFATGGLNHIVPAIVYMNYMKVHCATDSPSTESFQRIDNRIKYYLALYSVPLIVQQIYSKMSVLIGKMFKYTQRQAT